MKKQKFVFDALQGRLERYSNAFDGELGKEKFGPQKPVKTFFIFFNYIFSSNNKIRHLKIFA